MNELGTKLGERFTRFLVWAIDNHPGKLVGTLIGLVFGILMVTLGFWRTLVLAMVTALGFVLGKRQDDHQSITSWIDRNFKKY